MHMRSGCEEQLVPVCARCCRSGPGSPSPLTACCSSALDSSCPESACWPAAGTSGAEDECSARSGVEGRAGCAVGADLPAHAGIKALYADLCRLLRSLDMQLLPNEHAAGMTWPAAMDGLLPQCLCCLFEFCPLVSGLLACILPKQDIYEVYLAGTFPPLHSWHQPSLGQSSSAWLAVSA